MAFLRFKWERAVKLLAVAGCLNRPAKPTRPDPNLYGLYSFASRSRATEIAAAEAHVRVPPDVIESSVDQLFDDACQR